MESATRENSSTTSAKEMELSFGLMDAVISEDGAVVNKTALAPTSIKMERKGTESGRTGKKCNGLMEKLVVKTNSHELVLYFCLLDA